MFVKKDKSKKTTIVNFLSESIIKYSIVIFKIIFRKF